MHSQMVVILEQSEPKRMSVNAAQRIAGTLLGTRGPNGEVRLQRSIAGEVTPNVAFQLTEVGATFTLSGTSGRVHDKLSQLCPNDFGPGTLLSIDDRNALVIKSCSEFPHPKPPTPASEVPASGESAFNQALDTAFKLTSLAIQAWQPS